ncbi:hypothetical protein TRAPUB_9633 [Trametes pubescens]|uniref:Ribonuclease H1 N-terminal domain-containing protein n=1 Tax=Trametes pubescens TaxID=154538 RepID=A0A1M2W221_TRAPU|nr:hypothetical protein TRAPUB_9633 [Trametes pubescens]
MKIDMLNSEVFAHIQDPDDAQEIAEALKSSRAVTRAFTHGEKLYAVRYGKETGVYGVEWDRVFPNTKGAGASQKSFSSLLEALLWMLRKSDAEERSKGNFSGLPSTRAGSPVKRTASPVKREASPVKVEDPPLPSSARGRVVRSASPLKATHSQTGPTISPSVLRGVQAESLSRSTSYPPVSVSPRGFPIIPLSSRGAATSARIPAAPQRPHSAIHFSDPTRLHGTSYGESASARFPTSSVPRFQSDIEIEETFVEDLDGLHLETARADRGESHAVTMNQLCRLVRPPTEMLAGPDALLPPLNLGPEADRWFVAHNMDGGSILRYLQVFLYVDHVSDFTRLVGQPGQGQLSTADAQYLWELLLARFEDAPLV